MKKLRPLLLLAFAYAANASNPIITDVFTADPAAIEFKGQWYFLYHNGGIQHPNTSDSYRRAVCIDYLYHNPDGTLRRVVQTTEGVSVPPQP
ncbi:hypothetical protein QEH56_04710 [Pelagicoccus enzymogenes]|uniref:hypothetical protein n=1 Tax=Pelagicoccus enzymogenes TaxID=2773457 RepID=UPI00280FD81C|nr:hypothetical protein [Pelagicoccus enzymogenes]MDQ8197435.1 hypothetical protein [Pelagicoccus enzymogenes]